MQKIKLYGLDISVYTRIVRLVLEEKQLSYDLLEVDIFSDDGPPAWYKKKNPFATIPTLDDHDISLFETFAICKYLDKKTSENSLQPTNNRERARMNQVIGVLDSYAYKAMIWDVFVQRIVHQEEDKSSDDSVIATALPQIAVVAQWLSECLGNKTYLIGSSISLADLHTYPMLLYFSATPEGKTMLDQYKNLQHWLECLSIRPSVIATRSKYG